MDSEEPGQTRVKLELKGLVIQEEEDCAANILIARSLDLKSISFLGRRCSVPLYQMVVRSVQILVQLNHQRFKEG